MDDAERGARHATLFGVLLALFLGALDQTIVATALPHIVADLGGLDRYAHVATAYFAASTALVPIFGKLADVYSRKAIQLVAIGVFLAGSLLCGAAGEFGTLPLVGDGMDQLVACRAIQGAGSAGLFSLAFIVIADLFPAAERGKYQSFVGAAFGVASVLGPFLGGLLADHAGGILPGIEGWRWVFYVNLPVGLLALGFVSRKMPRLEPPGPKEPLDILSAALLAGGIVAITLALQRDKRDAGWLEAPTLSLFGGGALLLALFVARARTSPSPVLDLKLFESAVFRRGILALVFLGAAFLSLLVFLPLFLVNVVGVSATGAGMSLIPLSLGLVAGSIVAGQLVSRLGHYRRWMLGGILLLGVSTALLATLGQDATQGTVTLYMALAGLGLGPTMPLYPLAIQNAVHPGRLGQATSATQFFRQMGGVVGTALMGAVLTASLPPGAVDAAPAADAASLAIAPELQAAFAGAIRRIFGLAFVLVVAAGLATLSIPELPLRKTSGLPPPEP